MTLIIIASLFGQVLVTKNKRNGYLIWTIADAVLAIINFMSYPNPLAVSQGILWTLYFIISLWGYLRFKETENRYCDSYYR
jgi:nicotinamide riboside transporter PnuC